MSTPSPVLARLQRRLDQANQAVLWSAALFVAVAVVGHLLYAPADVLWLILLFFGVTAVPAAFRDPERGE